MTCIWFYSTGDFRCFGWQLWLNVQVNLSQRTSWKTQLNLPRKKGQTERTEGWEKKEKGKSKRTTDLTKILNNTYLLPWNLLRKSLRIYFGRIFVVSSRSHSSLWTCGYKWGLWCWTKCLCGDFEWVSVSWADLTLLLFTQSMSLCWLRGVQQWATSVVPSFHFTRVFMLGCLTSQQIHSLLCKSPHMSVFGKSA